MSPKQSREAGAGGTLRAGVARSDITCDADGTLVHDPLYARALVLDDGATRVAIVAMDCVSIGDISDVRDDFLPKLRARIESEAGIPGTHVLVNASHTHPPGRILCEDEDQVSRTLDAVRRAAADLVPVKVGVGRGHEDRFTINRTLRMKDGTAWTIRHAHPCPPDDEVAELGPLDPEIGVLRVDRLDGTPFAVVFNFACHPLYGFEGRALTANYPGFAGQVIEDNLGHGAMALFLQGAGGDVCDVLYKEPSRPRDVRPFGMMLGLSTLQAWSRIETGEGALKVVTEAIRLPRRQDIPQRVEAELKLQDELVKQLAGTSLSFKVFLPLYIKYGLNPDFPADYSYRYLKDEALGRTDTVDLDEHNRQIIAKYLHSIKIMERLARIQDDVNTLRWHQAHNEASGEDTIAAEVQGIRIGDFVLISSPAEVLTRVGLRVKQASPHPYTFMSAFSSGYVHYGAPADEYAMGGYEVTECMLAPEWQELYEKAAAKVLSQL
jgi:hypothetical protein